MGTTNLISLPLEVAMSRLPDGVNIIESGGKTIFEVEGEMVCYLEKRLIYKVSLNGVEPTIEAVSNRLVEALNDFNQKTGEALVLSK